MSSILFGDTMVPNIEYDGILLLGYSLLYKEYNLTSFNHQKTLLTLQSMAAVPDCEPVESLSVPVGIQVYKYSNLHWALKSVNTKLH